jgi:hypothetical protein
MGGKLETPGRFNTIAPGVLVHVVDQICGWRFLVDTGAAFSIIPHSSSLPATGRGIVGGNWPSYQVVGGEVAAAEAVGSVLQA